MLDAPQIPVSALGGLNQEDAALVAHGIAEIERLAETAYRYEAEQTEAFLAAHIGLANTHALATYPPVCVEGPNGEPLWAVPKALLPIGEKPPLTHEDAQNLGLPITFVIRLHIVFGPPRPFSLAPPLTSQLTSQLTP